jgi:hypothetical protein
MGFLIVFVRLVVMIIMETKLAEPGPRCKGQSRQISDMAGTFFDGGFIVGASVGRRCR